MKLMPNKNLKISMAELKTWPYWKYGYYGSDGCDWREYPTADGMAGIPDYAEEAMPLTKEQARAYNLPTK